MITNVNLVPLGKLYNQGSIYNTVEVVNQVQNAFQFLWRPGKFDVNLSKYKLPNKGYDFDRISLAILKKYSIPGPSLFITSEPYSTKDEGKEPEYFYFSGENVDYKNSTISTYLWRSIEKQCTLQKYLLIMFATTLISFYTDMSYHDDTKGCIFDYCDDPNDFVKILSTKGLCDDCDRYLNDYMQRRKLSMDFVASVKKIINRALEIKQCFLVMPFKKNYNIINTRLHTLLEKNGWTVYRGDELSYPRKITDAIHQALKISNLMIADISEVNPNVFYEIGYAHAIGCDVLLLSTNKKIPFDIKDERVVLYSNRKSQYSKLEKDIKRMINL